MIKVLFSFFGLSLAQTLLGPTNSTWNYDQHGTDWTMYSTCMNNSTHAPQDLTCQNSTATPEYKTLTAYNWAYYNFAFLPDFSAATATWYGQEQWVYQMFGDFGGIYATEPIRSVTSRVLYWDATNILFHYPSEQLLNGTQYALELQVHGYDTFNRKLGCQSRNGYFSVLFDLVPAGPANPFFEWQAAATAGTEVVVDLNLVLSRVAGTVNSVIGYSGTNSMPPCSTGTCYYVV